MKLAILTVLRPLDSSCMKRETKRISLCDAHKASECLTNPPLAYVYVYMQEHFTLILHADVQCTCIVV